MPPEHTSKTPIVALAMVRDAYGNFVVQTALKVIPESVERRKLLEVLHVHIDELRRYTFAKNIVAMLSKRG
jgi:hypothetical protein